MTKLNLNRYINIVIILSVILAAEISLINIDKNNIKKQHKLEDIYKQMIEKMQVEGELHIQELKREIENKEILIKTLSKEHGEMKEVVKSSRGESDRWEKFRITAYDLSIQSCGKKKTHPEYGITAIGYNLKGQNWETARVVACDPKVIPLGSKIKIIFIDEDYQVYNGEYTCADTGRLIKGQKLDFFYEDTGETVSTNALNFGITEAYVQILENNS